MRNGETSGVAEQGDTSVVNRFGSIVAIGEQEFRDALRRLGRSPAFSATVIAVMSLGIGLNLCMYKLTRSGFYQPPVADPPSLVRFERMYAQHGLGRSWGVPYDATEVLRSSPLLSAVLVLLRAEDSSWGRLGEEPLKVHYVSANWFTQVPCAAAQGRMFVAASEGRPPEGAGSAVLSHAFWQTRFGGSNSALGQLVWINRRPVVIVGIAGPNCVELSESRAEVWLPVEQFTHFNPGTSLVKDGAVEVYARLAAGVSLHAVRDGIREIIAGRAIVRPSLYYTSEWLEPYPSTDGFLPPEQRHRILTATRQVAAASGLLYLIACVNIGALVLARAYDQSRGFAVRAALGATPGKLVRHIVIECGVLASCGTAGALLVASWAATVLARELRLPAHVALKPDGESVLVGLAGTSIAIVLMGVLPALRASSCSLSTLVHDGGRQVTIGVRYALWRQVLVMAQVSVMVVCVTLSAVVVDGLVGLMTEVGYEFDRVAILEAPLRRHGIAGANAQAFWTQVKQTLRADPTVGEASLVSIAPLSDSISETRYRGLPNLRVTTVGAEPEFFRLMSIPILSGRIFGEGDDPKRVVVVSKSLAVRMYGRTDVVGEPFPKDTSAATIIGVAGNASLINLRAEDGAEAYRPLGAEAMERAVLLARAKSDARRLLPALRYAAQAANSAVIPQARLMASDYGEKVRVPRLAALAAVVLTGFTLISLLIGMFSMMSSSVRLRMRELAIRMAVGAEPDRVARLLLRRAALMSLAGGAAGALAAGLVLQGVQAQFAYLRAPGNGTLALITAATLGVSLTATVPPVLRAIRLNISQLLNGD